MIGADFLVIGGGVAGLSAAARLARHGRTIVIEAEEAVGYHASGRSATFSHYGIGDAAVRALTLESRSFFLEPPPGFADAPICKRKPALFIASDTMKPALDALAGEMARFSDRIDAVSEARMAALCPVLRFASDAVAAGVVDRGGLKLDSDALLRGYVRLIRSAAGAIFTGRRIAAIERTGAHWRVSDAAGRSWQAPVLINAAGAWADRVAALAGVRPLGLRALRRTIIVVDPPAQTIVNEWPFVKTAVDDFYMLPEGGRIMASPVDEVPDDPSDAQPEEYDLALAADRLQHYTTLQVRRIAHRWAGLRTFTSDRVPVAGFAPDAFGFFWLAGQGGYGLQTAPAMALAVEALVCGSAWPAALRNAGVERETLAPRC
jgi:D-arginine dehydrogenase